MSTQKSIVDFAMSCRTEGPQGHPKKRTALDASLQTNPSEGDSDDVFQDTNQPVPPPPVDSTPELSDDMGLKEFITSLMKQHSDQIQGEFRSLKQSVDSFVSQTNDRINALENENATLKSELGEMRETVVKVSVMCNQNNQYSRKNSIRVFGIPEDDDPKTENCSLNIVTHLNKPGLPELSAEDIEVSHRIGRFSAANPKPRAIIAKFVRRPVKDNLMRKRKFLKGSNIVIYDDLSPMNMELLNRLKKHEKIDQAWSTNGKILGKLLNGDIRVFNIDDDLSLLQ